MQHEIHAEESRPMGISSRCILIHDGKKPGVLNVYMIECDVYKPSNSPWSSPVVLVKKKNGSLRLDVDYRKLNDITRCDSFPLQRVDAILNSLK